MNQTAYTATRLPIVDRAWEVHMRIGNYQVVRNTFNTTSDSWAVRDARTGMVCLQNSKGHAIYTAKNWKRGDENGSRPQPSADLLLVNRRAADAAAREASADAQPAIQYRPMAARFASKCPHCGRGIDEGAPIAWAPGQRALHAECAYQKGYISRPR